MFSVYRTNEAQGPLRAAWEQAGSALRKAILQATHEVDQLLYNQPHEQGESRGGQVRILFLPPLGILFEVDHDKRLVTILRSWAFRAREDRDGRWE